MDHAREQLLFLIANTAGKDREPVQDDGIQTWGELSDSTAPECSQGPWLSNNSIANSAGNNLVYAHILRVIPSYGGDGNHNKNARSKSGNG
jgi:hypothetical protein